jgi:hypothetical protein
MNETSDRRGTWGAARSPGAAARVVLVGVSRYDSDSVHMRADHHRARKHSGKRTEALSGRIPPLSPPGPAPSCAPSSRRNQGIMRCEFSHPSVELECV